MIILKKESDIKKLKLWDPRISQEELDLADKWPSEDIVKINNKRNDLVDKHTKKIIELYIKKLEEKRNKKK